MNISINSFDFDIHNVSFLEPKKNILMEGYFTKINYLSQWFTMSGLFFYLPIKIKSIIKEKSCIKFDPYLPENHGFIQKFAAIENYLLDFYNYYPSEESFHLLNRQHSKMICGTTM